MLLPTLISMIVLTETFFDIREIHSKLNNICGYINNRESYQQNQKLNFNQN